MIPVVAVTATVLETGLAILLLLGYHTRFAAFSAGGLTLLFAMAMLLDFRIHLWVMYLDWEIIGRTSQI